MLRQTTLLGRGIDAPRYWVSKSVSRSVMLQPSQQQLLVVRVYERRKSIHSLMILDESSVARFTGQHFPMMMVLLSQLCFTSNEEDRSRRGASMTDVILDDSVVEQIFQA